FPPVEYKVAVETPPSRVRKALVMYARPLAPGHGISHERANPLRCCAEPAWRKRTDDPVSGRAARYRSYISYSSFLWALHFASMPSRKVRAGPAGRMSVAWMGCVSIG